MEIPNGTMGDPLRFPLAGCRQVLTTEIDLISQMPTSVVPLENFSAAALISIKTSTRGGGVLHVFIPVEGEALKLLFKSLFSFDDPFRSLALLFVREKSYFLYPKAF